MNKIKIEKNIPLPGKFNTEGYHAYPFEKMKKGDSFLFKKTYTRKSMRQAHGYSRSFTRLKGGQFTVAKHNGGIRIWKVK